MQLAHSEGINGEPESVSKHIVEVADESANRAAAFGAAEEARLIGYYHDVGKLGHPFQQRIKGLASGIDHWSLGAYAAFEGCPRLGRAAMLCVPGHHLGIPEAMPSTSRSSSPRSLVAPRAGGRGLKHPGTRAVFTVADPGFLSARTAHGVSEFAPVVLHYFAQCELRTLFGEFDEPSFREYVEKDSAHGAPHGHGYAVGLFQRP